MTALWLTLFAPSGLTAATGVDDAPPAPVDTVTEFFPENANLSDCVGLVERPGCGSEARGGWGQTLVFVALAGGLGIIFWRVSRGVRANRAAMAQQPDRASDPG